MIFLLKLIYFDNYKPFFSKKKFVKNDLFDNKNSY